MYNIEIQLKDSFSELEERLDAVSECHTSGTNMLNGNRDLCFEVDKPKAVELLTVLFNHENVVDELLHLSICPV